MAYRAYGDIVKAIETGILIEPFTAKDFCKACPGWATKTYSNFLPISFLESYERGTHLRPKQRFIT